MQRQPGFLLKNTSQGTIAVYGNQQQQQQQTQAYITFGENLRNAVVRINEATQLLEQIGAYIQSRRDLLATVQIGQIPAIMADIETNKNSAKNSKGTFYQTYISVPAEGPSGQLRKLAEQTKSALLNLINRIGVYVRDLGVLSGEFQQKRAQIELQQQQQAASQLQLQQQQQAAAQLQLQQQQQAAAQFQIQQQQQKQDTDKTFNPGNRFETLDGKANRHNYSVYSVEPDHVVQLYKWIPPTQINITGSWKGPDRYLVELTEPTQPGRELVVLSTNTRIFIAPENPSFW